MLLLKVDNMINRAAKLSWLAMLFVCAFVLCRFAVTLYTGTSANVEVRIVQHKRYGDYYILLYQVLQPTNLSGRYGTDTTWRSNMVANVDGGRYELRLIQSSFAFPLESTSMPDWYFESRPSREHDFFNAAKKVK